MHVLRIIQAHMPKIVVLENVSGLATTQREFFDALLGMIREFRWQGRRYVVEWRVMDTRYFKVAQSRPRLWIVCVRRDVLGHALEWPTPNIESATNIDEIIGPRPPRCTTAMALPPETSTNAVSNVKKALLRLQHTGVDPFSETWILEIDQSASRNGTAMRGCSPCLTKTRCRQGGHWITTNGRRLSTAEMLSLQKMCPDRLRIPDGVSVVDFHGVLGF